MIDDAEIDDLMRRYNTWGMWGAEDQKGTLNLLTPQRGQVAAALIAAGRSVPLGRPMEFKTGPHNSRPVTHFMTELHNDDPTRARGTASDWFGIGCHGFAITHLDALCHQSWRGKMYNDRPAAAVTARACAPVNGVDSLASGVFGRAVFLDIPAHRGVEWLEPGDAVRPDELDAALAAKSLSLDPGDILLVSTGRDARTATLGELEPLSQGNPGLSLAVTEWLFAHQPSVVVTDVQCDAMIPADLPHPMPLHVTCLVGMGIHLIDNASFSSLIAACDDAGRWEFAVSVTVPHLLRATGAMVNPVALF